MSLLLAVVTFLAVAATTVSATLSTLLKNANDVSNNNTSGQDHAASITDQLWQVYTNMDSTTVRLILDESTNLPNQEYIYLLIDLFSRRPEDDLARFLRDKQEVFYEHKMSMAVTMKSVIGGVDEQQVLYNLERQFLGALMNQSDYLQSVHEIYQNLYNNFPQPPSHESHYHESHYIRKPQSRWHRGTQRRNSSPPSLLFLLIAFLVIMTIWLLNKKLKQRTGSMLQDAPVPTTGRSMSLQDQIHSPSVGFNPYRVQVVQASDPPPAYTPR